MKAGLGAIAVCALFGLAIWYEVTVWRECMTDHSWWYCVRIIGR